MHYISVGGKKESNPVESEEQVCLVEIPSQSLDHSTVLQGGIVLFRQNMVYNPLCLPARVMYR